MADAVQIYSANFNDGSVMVTYAEERDVGSNVVLQKTIVVAASMVEGLLADVLDSLQDIVDVGLADLQSPAAPRRRRHANVDIPSPPT